MLSEEGVEVLDADRVGHAVLDPGGACFEEVARRWPQAVVGGRIDRSRLAAIVFEHPGELRALEQVTHPVILERIYEASKALGPRSLVVEASAPGVARRIGWPVIVVDAPDEVRLARLVARGSSREDALRRMRAQPSRQEWMDGADVVVTNDRTLDELREAVVEAADRLGVRRAAVPPDG